MVVCVQFRQTENFLSAQKPDKAACLKDSHNGKPALHLKKYTGEHKHQEKQKIDSLK